MEPWDVTMSDLLSGAVNLDAFQGIVFVGGFSYADTLDSAKGWASAIRFSDRVLSQFEAFYRRQDTFSLGVCNGCQLLALLGWVPSGEGGHLSDLAQPRFVHNASGTHIDVLTNSVLHESLAPAHHGCGCADHGQS